MLKRVLAALFILCHTELKNFPLYCPKCRQESLINAKDLQVTVIKGIEMKTQNVMLKRVLAALFILCHVVRNGKPFLDFLPWCAVLECLSNRPPDCAKHLSDG